MFGSNEYKIQTKAYENGLIEQTHLVRTSLDEAPKMLSRWVADSREEGVRASLIKLGWTPPPDNYRPEYSEHVSAKVVSKEELLSVKK